MDPGLGLLAATGLANLLLKTTAEWLACLLLARLARTARTRFNLWLAVLLGFVAQWAWMGVGLLRAASGTWNMEGGAGTAAAGARIALAEGTAGALARTMAALGACYLVVVLWRMAGALAARTRLARAMRHRSAPQGELAAAFEEALGQSAERGAGVGECELWVLPGLGSPATLGWWRPRVVVPPVCRMRDAAELKAVFWHELKHLERRDTLWNAVAHGCRDLLWFHPAVHHATAALDAERELACDASVVQDHPQSRDLYASCLVRFARYRDLEPGPSAAGVEMASGAALLTARVRSILDEAPGASRTSRAWRVGASVLLAGLMAATVPALNVLFAAEERGPATGAPVRTAASKPARTSAIRARRAQARAAASAPKGDALSTGPETVAVEHDGDLAAEHRAAMGILTESTGMDTPAASGSSRWGADGRIAAGGHGTAGQATPSWMSVAVDAAAKAGPLMVNDHDADDRH